LPEAAAPIAGPHPAFTRTKSSVIVDDVRRYFYYVGWRWDL
jgi:hypothetical protein